MHLFDALTEPKKSGLRTWAGNGFESNSWNRVVADAHRMAVGFRRLGLTDRATVAAVITNSRHAVTGVLGIWLAGGTVASMPVPARGMGTDEYAEQLERLCHHTGATILAIDERLLAFLPDFLTRAIQVRSWESVPRDGQLAHSPPGEDDLAFIQYSSGSTSAPKGCMLTPRAIGNQLEMIAEKVDGGSRTDTVVSWLPLSHDMGMFASLLYPWVWDCSLILSTPERFMLDPRTWFADCSEFEATLTGGPTSALHLAARVQGTNRLPRELRLRACTIAGERIAASSLEFATAVYADYGMTMRTWMPGYGLAEATLVVSAVNAGEDLSWRCIDSVTLADGEISEVSEDDPRATKVVSTGHPCSGVEVRTADPHCLSEIYVRSQSLSSGYFGEPEMTEQCFHAGEFATADLGFIADGQVYVVGRVDDLLSVGGRNVYAREIEAAVDQLRPVRRGCSAIVDAREEGRKRLVMLVELRDVEADYRKLAAEAARTARAKAGVLLDECLFLRKGVMPKTPSGKIQRFRCRQLLLANAFDPIARVELRARG